MFGMIRERAFLFTAILRINREKMNLCLKIFYVLKNEIIEFYSGKLVEKELVEERKRILIFIENENSLCFQRI